ncbi:MAG: hypothetical protein ACK6EB_31900, partial [Planctomyces sp.]
GAEGTEFMSSRSRVVVRPRIADSRTMEVWQQSARQVAQYNAAVVVRGVLLQHLQGVPAHGQS